MKNIIWKKIIKGKIVFSQNVSIENHSTFLLLFHYSLAVNYQSLAANNSDLTGLHFSTKIFHFKDLHLFLTEDSCWQPIPIMAY